MRIKSIQQYSDPFRVNCYFPMEENGLAPFESGSESASCVKADWNCRLQISAFSLVSVFRILFSLSEAIPNVSFFIDLTNDRNFLSFPLLFESGSEGLFSNVKIMECVSNRHLSLPEPL